MTEDEAVEAEEAEAEALESTLSARIRPGQRCEQFCRGENPATEVVVGGPTRREYAAYCCTACAQRIRAS